MSIKVDDASPYDADPEVLQTATLYYPFTFPTNGSTITAAELAYRAPPPTAVRLADGRVLHCQVCGYTDTGRYARLVYLFYASDETTYCTTHNSCDWDSRILLFDTGAVGHANVVASISRIDENTLGLVVSSDATGTNMKVGNGCLYPPPMACMAYNSATGQMYGTGTDPPSNTGLGGYRLWKVDPTDATLTVIQNEYAAAVHGTDDYGFEFSGRAPIAYDSTNNNFYQVDGTNLCSVNLTTGKRTTIGLHGAGAEVRGMAYDSAADIMYASTAANLYTVNRATGAFTLVGAAGVGSCKDIEYDVTNDVLYGLHNDTLYTVNRGTGAWTSVGSTGETNCNALGYDSDNDILYGSSVTVDVGAVTIDTPYIWTVVRSTGDFNAGFETPYPNYIDPWTVSPQGIGFYYSTDDGLTWTGGHGQLSSMEEIDDYAALSTITYDATLYPKVNHVTMPTSTANVDWARTDQACTGNNGIIYRAGDGNYYVTASIVVRDDASPNTYNKTHPCLLRIQGLGSANVYPQMLWPAVGQVDIDDVPNWWEQYGEGTAPDWDWLAPPTIANELDHDEGPNNTTRGDWASANLFEANGRLYFTTSGTSSLDTHHRLWYFDLSSEDCTWVANTPDYASTWYRCSDGYLDGALVWFRSGGVSGGLWVGDHRDEPITTPAVQTQLVAGSGYDIRNHGAVHQGCTYIWCTWWKSDTNGAIGIRAAARQPCLDERPFEFPHPWYDILRKWDDGDQKGALLLLDRNNAAIEEITFDRAVCHVPEYPHPWGEMVLKALKGDKLWRDVLEEQEKYMVEYLSSTCRYAKTPWTFTTKWHDILPLWGQSPGKDQLIESIIDGMWEHFQAWQQHASDYSGLPLCDGSDDGMWVL